MVQRVLVAHHSVEKVGFGGQRLAFSHPTWLNRIHFIPHTPDTSRLKTAAELESLPLFLRLDSW
jgi:hypothetical protein